MNTRESKESVVAQYVISASDSATLRLLEDHARSQNIPCQCRQSGHAAPRLHFACTPAQWNEFRREAGLGYTIVSPVPCPQSVQRRFSRQAKRNSRSLVGTSHNRKQHVAGARQPDNPSQLTERHADGAAVLPHSPSSPAHTTDELVPTKCQEGQTVSAQASSRPAITSDPGKPRRWFAGLKGLWGRISRQSTRAKSAP